ncbi:MULTISPECIES: OmpH family outer membrane protein [unclassified Francisella]|uniref:OmpH family outer membrane protein n=1 Tax=unclassified Francisella TaxID=2610885 RepID=UPI002E3824BD|nr:MULTISPECIES: OmpH family outer membrane protein [unclassified Francisella]MED7819416.1 OmpH family outer membrane protein [Francisella sp. 19S2-4]MED7830205.1 OmpH family outer membrane protein [Francisella sp. 19S2-10]
MKKIILSLSVMAAAFTGAYADVKIAVVNPVEIFNDSDLGSVSVKKLENDLKPQATQLKQEQDNIMQQMKTLQENSATMTKQELTQKQQQIQKEEIAFREKAMVLQKKENTSKDELAKKFQASFDRAVQTIAKQKGYNAVLTTQALAYVNGIDDISSDVITLMNKDSN